MIELLIFGLRPFGSTKGSLHTIRFNILAKYCIEWSSSIQKKKLFKTTMDVELEMGREVVEKTRLGDGHRVS